MSKGTNIGDGLVLFGREGFAALPVQDRVIGEVVDATLRKAVEAMPVGGGRQPQVCNAQTVTAVRSGATTVEYEVALRVRVDRRLTEAEHGRMVEAALPIPGAA